MSIHIYVEWGEGKDGLRFKLRGRYAAFVCV